MDPNFTTLQRTKVRKPERSRFGGSVPNEVTPDAIKVARRAARAGRPGKLFGIFEYFYRLDDEIPGALDSLIGAIIQDDPEITPTEDTDEAQQQVDDVQAWFRDLDLLELLREGLEAHYYGFNAAWLPWQYFELSNGSRVQGPPTYELLPRDWIYADRENSGDDHTTLYVGHQPYHEYPNGSLLLFSERKLTSYADIDFTRFGRGLAASRFACFSYFNHEDWSAYNEVFGIPMILGKLLEGWKDEDKETLKQAVFGIANDARGIITDKGQIETISPDGGGSNVFDRSDEVWRKARARIIKSESLTDNMGDAGSFAAMVTVNGIRLDIAKRLAHRLTRMLYRRLVKPFCELNYGRCLVNVNFHVAEVKNMLAELSIDKGMQEMGLDLSRAEVYERYGRRMPDADDPDDVLPGRSQGGALGGLDLFGGGG